MSNKQAFQPGTGHIQKLVPVQQDLMIADGGSGRFGRREGAVEQFMRLDQHGFLAEQIFHL